MPQHYNLWTSHTDTVRSGLAIGIHYFFQSYCYWDQLCLNIERFWYLILLSSLSNNICFISEYLTAILAFILNLICKHSPKPCLPLASSSLLFLCALNWAHQELLWKLWCSLAMISVLLHLPQNCSDCLVWRSMFVVDPILVQSGRKVNWLYWAFM